MPVQRSTLSDEAVRPRGPINIEQLFYSDVYNAHVHCAGLAERGGHGDGGIAERLTSTSGAYRGHHAGKPARLGLRHSLRYARLPPDQEIHRNVPTTQGAKTINAAAIREMAREMDWEGEDIISGR